MVEDIDRSEKEKGNQDLKCKLYTVAHILDTCFVFAYPT